MCCVIVFSKIVFWGSIRSGMGDGDGVYPRCMMRLGVVIEEGTGMGRTQKRYNIFGRMSS